MVQTQPNVSISSTKNTDFSIKENNRRKITKEILLDSLNGKSSFWKTISSISYYHKQNWSRMFSWFNTVILKNNLDWFVKKLNYISSISPTFNLDKFLGAEIDALFNDNSVSTDNDYFNQFSKDLEAEFQRVKGDFDNKIIATLKNKISPIFTSFNITNPTQTNTYIKLIGEINDHKNSIDPKWNFIQDNIKKVIDILETNKNSSYQIKGLSGFYNKVDWYKEFNAFFNKLGQYDTKKANDGFAKVVIESIVDDYKEQLRKLISNNNQTFEYRDLVEIFQDNSKNLDLLGKIDALFPGSKAIVEKIQKHSNKKEYGGFGISYSSLSENMKNINILFTWNYSNEKYKLINENNPVQNSKSDVQKAIKKFRDDSISKKIKINSDLDFSFRAIAKAKNNNVGVGKIYEDLMNKKEGEMNITEFLNFTKYSGEEYKDFKKIIDDIKNSTNTNNKLNVDFKVTYQIDDPITNNLLLKLVIWDKGIPNPNINNKDQIDSINLTEGINKNDAFTPKISIKLISKEIISLLSGAKFEIREQDFKDFDLNKNNKLDINYLKKLIIDKKVNGKLYKNLEELLNKYQKFGLSLKDIDIIAFVLKNKSSKDNYSIHFSVTDNKLFKHKKPSAIWGSIGAIEVISLKEQLEELKILEILHEYSGKPNSKFDTKNLTPNIDGPSITAAQINNSLKINDQNKVSLKKSRLNIIDRIQDIFKVQKSSNHKIYFANPFPFTIKWVTEKTSDGDINGHGLAWKFNFEGISAFDYQRTTLDSDDYNVVYEFTLATSLDKENSKRVVKKYGNDIIDLIKKNPLVTEEKRDLALKAIDDISKVIDGYVNKVNNNSSGWSKIRLKKEQDEAILKITKISEKITKDIDSSSIIKEISKILGRPLTDKETASIAQYAELFADLLDITKDKKVLEEVLKNKDLTEKLAKIAGKPILKNTLKALLIVKDNYQYAYLGVGIASGIAALAGAGSFFSSLRANRRLKKMDGKQARIKGAKLIAVITAFVTIGSMATSIVTLLWFFISKGGI